MSVLAISQQVGTFLKRSNKLEWPYGSWLIVDDHRILDEKKNPLLQKKGKRKQIQFLIMKLGGTKTRSMENEKSRKGKEQHKI